MAAYFYRCWGNVNGNLGDNLYAQAKKNAAEKRSEYERLQAKYNTSVDVSFSKIAF